MRVRIFNNDYEEICTTHDADFENRYPIDNEALHHAGWVLCNLKLPVCPNLWDDENRDVSMMILNELIPMVFTSSHNFHEEFSIPGGRIDLVGRRGKGDGDIYHAIEIELGNSARSDSDILKLAQIGEEWPHAELSIVAPSKELLKRWEKSTKSAEVICKSLKRLEGIVKNVERISVIEIGLPEINPRAHEVSLNALSEKIGLYKRTKGITKKDRREFICENQEQFWLPQFSGACILRIEEN